MIRYQLSMALVPIPNIFTYNINPITGNQPIMATIKAQISFAVTAKLISAFVFATRIVHFLFLLNPKF